VKSRFQRLLGEDAGQDLIEYALLACVIVLASIAGIRLVQTTLKTTYTSWNSGLQKCSQMPAPGAGGGC
jgi:Flp pilus assembly pilin Flp